jgi:hypothetical protein
MKSLMNITTGLMGLISVAALGAAQAQSALSRPSGTPSSTAASMPATVDIRANAPARTDVSVLCPGIHAELPELLARAAQESGREGTVQVSFQIEGSRITALQAQGGPRSLHRHVRTAVGGLACDNGAAGRQAVRLSVQFVDPSESTARRSASAGSPLLARVVISAP